MDKQLLWIVDFDGLEIHLKTIIAAKSLEISGWALN